jgi:DNA-binding transcriptional LysR family regulator
MAAVRQGIGLTRLPCFVGDPDPQLVRAPGVQPRLNGALWLLTHGDTRKTMRVRLFIEFAAHRLAAYAPRLAGSSVPGD